MPSLESPTLESVSAEFSDWRRQRNTPRTPEHLQRQAVELLNGYRISEVLKALGLSHKSLKRWRQRWSERPSAKDSAPRKESFIALPVITPETAKDDEVAHRVSLKLSRQDLEGRTLSIEANLDDSQWRWALKLLSRQDRI